MKLIHGQDPVKKEDGNPNNDAKSKIPLSDGLIGAGRAAKATILGISLVAALGIAKSGCTYDPEGLGKADASQDADAGFDAGPDADVDAGPDADLDAGPDADVDAGPDADVDAGPDADVDGGPVACVDADVGTFSGIINSSTPETVGGYVFEYQGIDELNALFHITCGGSVVEESLSCPLGSETIKDDIPSGRRIRINPIAAGATTTNSSITVELL